MAELQGHPDLLHIFPINDLFPHKTKGLNCSCNPSLVVSCTDGTYLLHHSWDRREVYEHISLLWQAYEGFGVHA
jgi:hypothetical protein